MHVLKNDVRAADLRVDIFVAHDQLPEWHSCLILNFWGFMSQPAKIRVIH